MKSSEQKRQGVALTVPKKRGMKWMATRILNLAFGEEFFCNGNRYRLTERGLAILDDNNNWNILQDNTLMQILSGKFPIKKIPWQPKAGEEYWMPSFVHNKVSTHFMQWDSRYERNKTLACRTEEEAVKLHDWIIEQVKRYRGFVEE